MMVALAGPHTGMLAHEPCTHLRPWLAMFAAILGVMEAFCMKCGWSSVMIRRWFGPALEFCAIFWKRLLTLEGAPTLSARVSSCDGSLLSLSLPSSYPAPEPFTVLLLVRYSLLRLLRARYRLGRARTPSWLCRGWRAPGTYLLRLSPPLRAKASWPRRAWA